jgi:Carbonic anhydrase
MSNKLFIFAIIHQLILYISAWDYFDQWEWPGICNTGSFQSPIDIITTSSECSSYETFSLNLYDTARMAFIFENNSWIVNSNDTFGIFEAEDVNGVVQKYRSHSFSLHSISEHKINGQRSNLELQLIFELDKSSPSITNHTMAIISVLFNSVSDNANATGFMEAVDMLYLEQQKDSRFSLNIRMNQLIGKLLIQKQNFTMYQGSLTYPTCDEIVNWYVVEKPLLINDHELSFFNSTYTQSEHYPKTGNAREIQLINARKIKRICNVTSRIENLFQNPAFYFLLCFAGLGYAFWKYYGQIPANKDQPIKGNIWTLHPLVSIISVPDKETFSRHCRIGILYVNWVTQMIVECIAFRIEGYYRDISSVYFALIGIAISIPITYSVGIFFRLYSKRLNENQRQMHFDSTRMLKYAKIFKIACISIISVGLLFLFWQISYLVGVLAKQWIISFAFGVFLDLCILDPLAIWVAIKNDKIADLLKFRGFYFDGDMWFYSILG